MTCRVTSSQRSSVQKDTLAGRRDGSLWEEAWVAMDARMAEVEAQVARLSATVGKSGVPWATPSTAPLGASEASRASPRFLAGDEDVLGYDTRFLRARVAETREAEAREAEVVETKWRESGGGGRRRLLWADEGDAGDEDDGEGGRGAARRGRWGGDGWKRDAEELRERRARDRALLEGLAAEEKQARAELRQEVEALREAEARARGELATRTRELAGERDAAQAALAREVEGGMRVREALDEARREAERLRAALSAQEKAMEAGQAWEAEARRAKGREAPRQAEAEAWARKCSALDARCAALDRDLREINDLAAVEAGVRALELEAVGLEHASALERERRARAQAERALQDARRERDLLELKLARAEGLLAQAASVGPPASAAPASPSSGGNQSVGPAVSAGELAGSLPTVESLMTPRRPLATTQGPPASEQLKGKHSKGNGVATPPTPSSSSSPSPSPSMARSDR